jgi:multidrug efflux pump
MLTLYTTPVVYLALDRLRLRVMGRQRDVFHADDGTIPATSE